MLNFTPHKVWTLFSFSFVKWSWVIDSFFQSLINSISQSNSGFCAQNSLCLHCNAASWEATNGDFQTLSLNTEPCTASAQVLGLKRPVWIPEFIYCFWEKQWCLLFCISWWNTTFKTTFTLKIPTGSQFLNFSLMVKKFPISSLNMYGQYLPFWSYANIVLQVK